MQGELSNREVGKRFRAAVRHHLAMTSEVRPGPSTDWLVSNGVAVAMRYSKRHATRSGATWFYGIGVRDCEHLASSGTLLLIVPEEDGHRFVHLDAADTKDLLTLCKGSERGDLKIHIRRDGRGEFSCTEWTEFPLQTRLQRVSAAALDAAGVTDEMGLLSSESEDEVDVDGVEDPQESDAATLGSPSFERVSRPIGVVDPVTLTLRTTGTDPAVTLARREQSHRAHQRLVAALDAYLRSVGWTEVEELAGAIDVRARRPLDGRRVIFECKSMRAERSAAELSRCRLGLAQLLEYRFAYGNVDDELCLVTDGIVSERRVQFLESLGIGCASFLDGSIVFLGQRAALCLAPPRREVSLTGEHPKGQSPNNEEGEEIRALDVNLAMLRHRVT